MRAVAVRAVVVLAVAVAALGGAAGAAQAEPRIEIGPVTVCKIFRIPIFDIPVPYDCYTTG